MHDDEVRHCSLEQFNPESQGGMDSEGGIECELGYGFAVTGRLVD